MNESHEVTVDFNSKDEARAIGVKFENGKWRTNSYAGMHVTPADDSHAVLAKFVTGLQYWDDKKEEFFDEFKVPEECLCSENDEAGWRILLHFTNWNALHAITMLHNCGLPRYSEERAMLLRYFATARPGEQYVADYESIADYCEKFKKAYGWDTLDRLRKQYRILGYDFRASLNQTEIPDEVRMLFLFAFPLSEKTITRERSTSTVVVQQEMEKVESEKQKALGEEVLECGA